jgi:hypothetical protein
MSELQTGATFDYDEPAEVTEEVAEAVELDEQEETENPESQDDGADLATDSEQGHEEKPETSQNENVQKVINRKHAEKMDAERRADAAEARLREFESRQQQYEPESPVLSDFPDPEEVADYNQKLRTRITWENQQSYSQQEYQRVQNDAATTKQAEYAKKGEAYTERAKSLGVSSKELQDAGNTVASYNLSEDIVLGILEDDQGALITTYLASNPLVLEDLKSLSPYRAALYMEAKVKPKIGTRKPKTSKAPQPALRVDGKASDPESKKYPNLKGAKFN